jgi:hypothetical protein
MQSCGPTCKQVNITVEVTYTGEGDELSFSTISMSVYVIDEKADIWFFEREDERKRIWSAFDAGRCCTTSARLAFRTTSCSSPDR